MAALSSAIIGGASLALGAGTSIAGMVGSSKARKELNNYKRQDLKNAFEDMPISTAGSDLMREESARTANTLTNSVARGGSRAITANIGRIGAVNNKMNQQAGMEIDRQYQDRNRMIASENSRIQDMYERREEADLMGLGQAMQAGRETTWNGMSAMQSGLNYAVNAEGGGGSGGGGGGSGSKGSGYNGMFSSKISF